MNKGSFFHLHLNPFTEMCNLLPSITNYHFSSYYSKKKWIYTRIQGAEKNNYNVWDT